jgi:hypothetical protein
VYIRNTWDNNPANTYSMIWDSDPSYSGMDLYSVSIVKLAASYKSSLIAPKDTIGVNVPRFYWTEIPDATAYRIQLYEGSYLQYTKTILSPYCDDFKCMKKFYVSLDEGWHKWRVKAKVGGVWRTYSDFEWFKVDARPTPYNPKGTIYTDLPRYGWSKNVDASSYQIQVLTGSNAWVYKKNIWSPYCTSTTCFKKFWVHLPNGTYKWRVQARVNGVLQPWSVWKWFTVNASSTPDIE